MALNNGPSESPWLLSKHFRLTGLARKRENKLIQAKQIMAAPLHRNGGFFHACEDLGENVRQFIPRLGTLIPLFMPGSIHSGSASRDDCGRMFPDKLRVSSFPDRFPQYAWTAAQLSHSEIVGSRLYAFLGVTCHLHLWQYDRGLLRASAVTFGWNWHRIRVSTLS